MSKKMNSNLGKSFVALTLSFGLVTSTQASFTNIAYATEAGYQPIVPISQDLDKKQDSLESLYEEFKSHWAFENIKFALDKELFLGLADKLEPNSEMTREMLVGALGVLSGEKEKATSDFTDVAKDSIFQPYIAWATNNKIVLGVGEGKFAPEASITREQLAVMFLNYMNVMEIAQNDSKDIERFSDDASISQWAKDAVYKMRNLGIINGKSNNIFDPKGTATIAEVAAMINKLYEYTEKPSVSTGAYTKERDLTDEDKAIFEEAMKAKPEVVYEPLKVSTQVVAGLNYKFYAKAKTTDSNSKEEYAYITIYKPLGDAKPEVTSIDTIK